MPTLSEDRDAIRDLYARYTLYLRTGEVDDWLQLFTDDPEFIGGGTDRAGGGAITGRAELEEHGRIWASQRVHRMILGHVIEIDGDTATCQASIIVYSGFTTVSVGSSSDELRRVEGSWRIHRRSFVPDVERDS